MKIKTYVLMSVVAFILIFVTAATSKTGIREGYRLGDSAPEIRLTDSDSDISFANHASRYTLLHFWAAYDGNSRKENVLLWNHLKKRNLPQIKMVSVSMDSSESVFAETIKIDGLESTNQEWQGKVAEVYRKYGLKKGLGNFLIDDKGVIIATNVTPEILDGIVD
ncbi:MAG: thioredoxin family protein [Tannerella sp.]|jgi:peroxiredoxin|nr:thioredoxin family protein [Tannerella sp.]